MALRKKEGRKMKFFQNIIIVLKIPNNSRVRFFHEIFETISFYVLKIKIHKFFIGLIK